jgi:hypothetical protein
MSVEVIAMGSKLKGGIYYINMQMGGTCLREQVIFINIILKFYYCKYRRVITAKRRAQHYTASASSVQSVYS